MAGAGPRARSARSSQPLRKASTQPSTPWSSGVGRSISSASIVAKAGGARRAQEFLRGRIPVGGSVGGPKPRSTSSSSRAAQRGEIARAAQLADKAPAGLEREPDGARGAFLVEHPVQGGVGESGVERFDELAGRRRPSAGRRAPWPAPRRSSSGCCRSRPPRRPRSLIRCVSVPSPQPTSRMCSPGCGASRSSAAAPSAGTKPPTRA